MDMGQSWAGIGMGLMEAEEKHLRLSRKPVKDWNQGQRNIFLTEDEKNALRANRCPYGDSLFLRLDYDDTNTYRRMQQLKRCYGKEPEHWDYLFQVWFLSEEEQTKLLGRFFRGYRKEFYRPWYVPWRVYRSAPELTEEERKTIQTRLKSEIDTYKAYFEKWFK